MAKITVNTDQVNEIATTMSQLNQKLFDQLTECKKTIDSLGANWSGEAFETTKASFQEFSGKYFDKYREIIENYVIFLRQNVSTGYFEVESTNINLSDNFK